MALRGATNHENKHKGLFLRQQNKVKSTFYEAIRVELDVKYFETGLQDAVSLE